MRNTPGRLAGISVIAVLLIFSQQNATSQLVADVQPAALPPVLQTVPDELFGTFIEFIWDTMNGPFGMYAQEIMHRGFDQPGVNPSIAESWQAHGNSASLGYMICTLEPGGVNPRGVFFQRIMRLDSSQPRSGIAQRIVINGSTTHSFFIYARGAVRKPAVELYQTGQSSPFFSVPITVNSDSTWLKTEMTIPKLPVSGRITLVVTFEGEGTLDLDEISLVPNDNVAGIRREYADYFKSIRPSLLRYPGGCFSDQPVFQWQHGIGLLVNRASPVKDWIHDYQRMDFGTDEYMKFCDSIGARPQLTVNFGSATPQDAANYLEYCNGDTTTTFGAMRAANGHPKPYNVKYVEIGNEQYGKWEIGHTLPELYAARAQEFSRKLKQVSPDVITMFNGDTWSFDWNERVITTAKDDIDLFSLHLGTGYGLDTVYSREFWYNLLVSDSKFNDKWMGWLRDAVRRNGLRDGRRIALTEWWHRYNGPEGLQHDPRFGSLQSGLWDALEYLHFIRWSDFYAMTNRTAFVGLVTCTLDPKTGIRFLYQNPSGYVLSMLRPFGGGTLLPLVVTSDAYTFLETKNIPYIEAVAVKKNDSVLLALVNRHPDSAIAINVLLPEASSFGTARYTMLTADHYTAINEAAAPNTVVPRTEYIEFSGKIDLPPHSFLIVAVKGATSGTGQSDTARFTASIQPNPADESVAVIITPAKNTGILSLSVFDALGKQALALHNIEPRTSSFAVQITTSELQQGFYVARISAADGNALYLPLVITR